LRIRNVWVKKAKNRFLKLLQPSEPLSSSTDENRSLADEIEINKGEIRVPPYIRKKKITK